VFWSREKCIWLALRPCRRILLLRFVMARASVPVLILEPDGSSLMSSASSSWWILSMAALEFLLALSPSSSSMPLSVSCLSGVWARESNARALSTLT